MQRTLEGRRAIVTGGSTGIGRATAIKLAEMGADVVISYLASEEAAREVVRDIQAMGRRAMAVAADATDAAQIGQLARVAVEFLGDPISILVNNAGALVQRCAIADMPVGLWEKVINLNLRSVFLTYQAFFPHLAKDGTGRIINLSSIAARTGGAGGSVAYATAKGAVNTFTYGLAKEIAQTGITVNAVSPGVIETPFHEKFTTPERMRAMVAGIPVGRPGTAEEVAEVIAFLASDAARYVTGQVWEVNGGQYTI